MHYVSPSSTPRWPTFPIIDTPRLAFRQTLEFEGGTPTAALEAQSCGGWTLMVKPKSTPNEKSSGEWREWLGATGIHIPWKYSQPSIRLWHMFTTFWGLSWIIFSISLAMYQLEVFCQCLTSQVCYWWLEFLAICSAIFGHCSFGKISMQHLSHWEDLGVPKFWWNYGWI